MHNKYGKLHSSKEKKPNRRKGLKHNNKLIKNLHEILFDVNIFNFFLHNNDFFKYLNFKIQKTEYQLILNYISLNNSLDEKYNSGFHDYSYLDMCFQGFRNNKIQSYCSFGWEVFSWMKTVSLEKNNLGKC